ncbi:MAG: response regulator transcription factor [Verrucomicrobiales bacterium]|nr:response regulator transcription factor [Verrucomicrobiales bacterium]
MSNSPIQVALVEDDDVIRESLAVLINGAPGFRCAIACSSGEMALEKLPGVGPGVVLMDIHLPGISGVETVRRLKPVCPSTQFIMLTMYEDDSSVFESLSAGATGYLLKRTAHAQVLEAIHDVWMGGAPMTSSIARKVVQSMQRAQVAQQSATPSTPSAPSSVEGLANVSPREEEVMRLLAQGFRYKEIADNLGITVETVRTHLRRIYDKLHVTSRTEAVVAFLKSSPR